MSFDAESTLPLQALELSEVGHVADTLELGAQFAEGGMGEILLGEQRRLQRVVAVKRAKGIRGAKSALITEALVTGRLEHPNIVPVYDLRYEADGPLMVMKRLEGTAWSDWIRTVGRVPLAPHIDIFLGVCSAMRFAHARGILHRDLKTDNVMIGAYGEVTLLDWGLAVSMRDEDAGKVPLARDVRRVAGTPGYMAPEMVQAVGKIDARTDVYLLGAILHVLLTGRTRHTGEELDTVLQAALRSEPPVWPAGVPEPLAEIAARATAADPAERYSSVQALQEAVVDYRQHQSSIDLTRVARRRTAVLRAMVEQALQGEDHDATTIGAMAIESRFGFRQALEAWQGNEDARRGLDEALEWAARFELHRGNGDAAAELMDELTRPVPGLAESLAQIRSRRALEDRAANELERLTWDRDVAVFGGRQGLFGCAMGIGVAGLCAGLALMDRSGLWPIGYPEFLFGMVGFVVLMFVSTAVGTRLIPNEVGQAQMRVARLIAVVLMAHWLAAAWMGLPMWQGMAWHAWLAAAMLVSAGLVVDRAAIAAGLVYFPTGLGILAWPSFALEIFGVGNVLSYAVFALWTSVRAGRSGARAEPAQVGAGDR